MSFNEVTGDIKKISSSIYNKAQFIFAIPLFLLGASIFISTIWALAHFGSTVLYWDQWDDLNYIRKFSDGSLRFFDLFNQHNEHRIFFPRLVFFLDYFISKSTNSVDFTANILIQVCALFLLGALYKKMERNWFVFVSLVSIAAAMIFSLAQYENFLWGFQVQFFGITAAATATFFFFGLSVERERAGRSPWGYRVAAYGCAFVSTYTLSNGVLAPMLLIPMALFLRVGRAGIIATVFCAVILALSYFLHFHPVEGHSPYIYSLQHPVEYIRYVCGYLGNVTVFLDSNGRAEPYTVVVVFGAIGLLLSVGALGRTVLGRDQEVPRVSLLAVILFITGTAMVTALGRITFGLGQSLSSRYVTPVSIFWVAHLFYWMPLRVQGRASRALSIIVGVIAALVATSSIRGHLDGLQDAGTQALIRARARDAFLSQVQDPDSYRAVYPVDRTIIEQLPFLRERHLSVFADEANRILGRNLAEIATVLPDNACTGSIDRLIMLSSADNQASFVTAGWAWSMVDGSAADRLVFTDGAGTIQGFAGGGWDRKDVPQALSQVTSDAVGWQGFLKASANQPVNAYAMLPHHRACKVAGTVTAAVLSGYVPMNALGAPLVMSGAPTLAGGWTKDGQNAVAGPSPVPDPVYGSWSGADSNIGELRFGSFVPPKSHIVFPIVTGPHTEGLMVVLIDEATGAEVARYSFEVSTTWTAMDLQIPETAVGKPMVLAFRDQGGGWGQWFAVGALHERSGGP
ncbi:hypothetical protein UCD39_12695 [Nitrospirillum sp. BR 11752]|uniref:hypothetical protein n=1 Tax=Nitrospirillum sp. BR 11752 TaxID=3104293 RepID=UPI002EC68791|nr:hypothetical protein [Nitrospirillum sp. BR 11752]